jgi:putative ABC transport system ATP-binding protein
VNSSKAVVDARELSRTFRMGETEVHALHGVSVRVGEGEMLSIMGASGSGKSTLMYIIGCLDKPTGGSYFLDGRDVSLLEDDELSEIRNSSIGFVFQAYHLIPQLNVLENVELPLFYCGMPQRERHERCREYVELVGLTERIGHRPAELSGGQMQRVAIARALVNDPVLVLADEPTGNLDSHSGEEILKVFERLHRMGKTIVMVTHNERIGSMAQRKIRLRDGEIVEDAAQRWS